MPPPVAMKLFHVFFAGYASIFLDLATLILFWYTFSLGGLHLNQKFHPSIAGPVLACLPEKFGSVVLLVLDI